MVELFNALKLVFKASEKERIMMVWLQSNDVMYDYTFSVTLY
jgi:hypothetical protein